jgi:hypothetical protein
VAVRVSPNGQDLTPLADAATFAFFAPPRVARLDPPRGVAGSPVDASLIAAAHRETTASAFWMFSSIVSNSRCSL